LAVAARARVLHVTLTYVACFIVLAVLRNLIVGGPLLAELAPITGPMYQLFVFFMVTDPRTTVSTRRERMIVVAIVAVVESLIRLAGDFQVPLLRPLYVSPPILALALVGPIAMYLDLRRVGGRVGGRGAVPASLVTVLAAVMSVASCGPSRSPGEKLARANCAVCHAFPEPRLLDKKTWQAGVLPQMAPRLGVSGRSLATELSLSPYMTVLSRAVPEGDWEKIVQYYLESAPDSLPGQTLPAQPELDPAIFKTGPFVPRLRSTGIITLLKVDQPHQRIFVGEAGSNRLMTFDWHRRLTATLALSSPPTGAMVKEGHLLVLESGILDPNDEPRGRLVEYDGAGHDSLGFGRVLIDSLFRPVFFDQVNFDPQGTTEFLVCEFGDNRGRLALYKADGAKYARQVLDPTPGAIRFEIHDLTGDGQPDIVALFAQGDERIALFANDGKGNFPGPPRILARFPPISGSMHFSMHDFNGDGKLDILYVNGDNFDFSRVLKPYHGIRILENDGHNNFVERYFFPIYGAAQAQVADFDDDGDLDIVSASNFAASRHAERGIMLFENTGPYTYRPYAFSIAAGNQWNVMATGDLTGDGRMDVIIGAMHLESIGRMQRNFSGSEMASPSEPILFFENTSRADSTRPRVSSR
jgi:hypothetical protein